MRTEKKAQPLAEQEIDQIVVAQAKDDADWGKPVRVRKTKTVSVPLPSALATRVGFFARLHREQRRTVSASCNRSYGAVNFIC